MKTISVPDSVDMTKAGKGKEVTLRGFFMGTLVSRMPQKTMSDLALLEDLSKKLEGEGDVELTDAEHELLLKSVPNDLPGTILFPLLPILRAIAGAD